MAKWMALRCRSLRDGVCGACKRTLISFRSLFWRMLCAIGRALRWVVVSTGRFLWGVFMWCVNLVEELIFGWLPDWMDWFNLIDRRVLLAHGVLQAILWPHWPEIFTVSSEARLMVSDFWSLIGNAANGSEAAKSDLKDIWFRFWKWAQYLFGAVFAFGVIKGLGLPLIFKGLVHLHKNYEWFQLKVDNAIGWAKSKRVQFGVWMKGNPWLRRGWLWSILLPLGLFLLFVILLRNVVYSFIYKKIFEQIVQKMTGGVVSLIALAARRGLLPQRLSRWWQMIRERSLREQKQARKELGVELKEENADG